MREGLSCVYCGDPADTMDHLTAVSRQTTRKRRGRMVGLGPTVPACALCNSTLGAAEAFTVRDRAAVLLLRYAERGREHAVDTARRLRRIVDVVAGFPLEATVEEINERQRRLLAERVASERRRLEDADEEMTAEERMRFEIAAYDLRQAQTPKDQRSAKVKAEALRRQVQETRGALRRLDLATASKPHD